MLNKKWNCVKTTKAITLSILIFKDHYIEMICAKFQLSIMFSFSGKKINIILRYGRFCKKWGSKSGNMDFSAVKWIMNGPNSLIWPYIGTLQLFGKFQGQPLSISVFIPIKHPQKGHFKGSKRGENAPNAVTLLLITRKVLGIFAFGKKFWIQQKQGYKMRLTCCFDPGPPLHP